MKYFDVAGELDFDNCGKINVELMELRPIMHKKYPSISGVVVNEDYIIFRFTHSGSRGRTPDIRMH